MTSENADPYRCAGCGKEYAGERMQCECATGVGVRRSDRMQIIAEQRREVRISFDEYQALQADRAAVAELVEVLSEMLAYSNGRTNPAHAKASAILSRHQAGMKDKDHG
jgi:hypothetical protein